MRHSLCSCSGCFPPRRCTSEQVQLTIQAAGSRPLHLQHHAFKMDGLGCHPKVQRTGRGQTRISPDTYVNNET
eukprot:11701552-Prorocentrum_lima.AAC.1